MSMRVSQLLAISKYDTPVHDCCDGKAMLPQRTQNYKPVHNLIIESTSSKDYSKDLDFFWNFMIFKAA
jgi:hypothetical protein